jgi:hypothetical protein
VLSGDNVVLAAGDNPHHAYLTSYDELLLITAGEAAEVCV